MSSCGTNSICKRSSLDEALNGSLEIFTRELHLSDAERGKGNLTNDGQLFLSTKLTQIDIA